jgi:hypothetical protein
MDNQFFIFLLLNSFFLLVFIFNQNEVTKDSLVNSMSSSVTNPFEQGTWICLFIQFGLLLFQTKLTNFSFF